MSRRREPRESADRRDDTKRSALEMVLDRAFRPMRWASSRAYDFGLQGLPVSVVRHTIKTERHAGALPLRIAFASDFHSGATTDNRVLRAACDALKQLAPDVLLLGGDMVSVRANDIHELAPLLADVPAPLGKFGVFGNHDLRSNYPVVRSALEGAGVRMLVNETVQLPAPHDHVTICGLDDAFFGTPRGDILDAVAGVRVVLMHEPDGLLAIGERHFDVAMCGHTHGGQIVLPGGIMPYLPHGKLSRTYPVGEYRLGERTLIVTRGVGCSTVPIRVSCNAEVHEVTIE